MLCTLCDSSKTTVIPGKTATALFFCEQCGLIMKDPAQHWDLGSQKLRYDQHNNCMDEGYVNFFRQLLNPLQPFLSCAQTALDWGSGPGDQPVLAELLRREGLQVDIYDPIYHPQLKTRTYDLITSTEVLEHFLVPQEALNQIFKHLSAGGIFAGLTQFHPGPEAVHDWWYIRDPTHVVFYSEDSFRWISQTWDLKILFLQNPVFIFQKN